MASNWYMSLYYKYRDYPVSQINNKYKRNELKNVYANIFNRFSEYFYIDLSQQSTENAVVSSSKKIINKKKSLHKFNSNLSFNAASKNDILGLPQTSSKKGDNLFQTLTSKILNSASQINQNDQFGQNSPRKIINLLSLITNTSKQLINTIILQQKNDHKESCSSLPLENSVLSQDNQKNQTNGQIEIQALPLTNQQANYYFIQFCSNVQIKQQPTPTPQQLHQGELGLSSGFNTVSQNDPNSFLKGIQRKLDKGQNQGKIDKGEIQRKLDKGENLDAIIKQIFNQQFSFSNSVLARFQQQTSTRNQPQKQIPNINIVLETWLQMIAMNQNQEVMYEVVEELVRDSSPNKYIEKINSYLHFVALSNTKTILVSTLSKSNFLCFLPEFLSGTRTLSDFILRKDDGLVTVYEKNLQRGIWDRGAYEWVIQKWGHIGQIVTQLLIKNQNIFWAKIFQSCCELLDQYLEQKVEISYSLLLLYEKIADESSLTVLNLPEWKVNYYQKAIKAILQRQIGFCSFDIPSVKSQIKSKISIADGSNAKSYRNGYDSVFHEQSVSFTFYDNKTADNQSKIFQLKQWERVVKDSIIRLKGYKKILDTGLQLFNGTADCVVIFFLETYFNFQKTQIVAELGFEQTVNKYCSNLTQIFIYQKMNQNSFKSQQVHSKLQQMQTHKNNHKNISKWILSQHKLQQLFLKQLKMQNNDIQKDQQRQRVSVNEEQTISYLQPSLESNYNQLKLLEDEMILPVFQTFVSEKEKRQNQREQSEPNNIPYEICVQLVNEINIYLKLVNECNFILSNVQQCTMNKIVSFPPGPQPSLPTPQLLVLSSREVSLSLNRLSLDHRQSKRPAPPSRPRKLSLSPKPPLTPPPHPSQPDYVRVLNILKVHTKCLEIMITLYYKSLQFYKQVARNLQCQQCFGVTDHNGKTNRSLQSQDNEEMKVKQMASKKFTQIIIQYQNIHKNGSKNALQDFEKSIEEQIQLNDLNTELFQIFTLISSLQLNHSTFLAIYKQELLSYEKLQRVRVIGKNYFEKVHSLLVQDQNCGDFFEKNSLETVKNLYLRYLMIVLVSLIQLVYERNQQNQDINEYANLMLSYFVAKICRKGDRNSHSNENDVINLDKIMMECFDWNQQNLPQISLKELILRLLELRTTPESERVVQKLKFNIESEFQILKKCQDSVSKVQYLKKKLLYLMFREVYFDCYYDIGIFEFKSLQARKNFQIYEAKMISFFDQIIKKDQQQYLQKQAEELKQRSAHLKGFLMDYQKQPKCLEEQRSCIIKTVCIFNKTLNILTQNRETQMKKRGSNSISILRKNRKKNDPIYMYYVSSEFIKPDGEMVKVFENDEYYFYRAIEIYQDMLCKRVESTEKKYSIYKDNTIPRAIHIGFTENDLQLVQKCRESLISLWVNFQYKILHESKMMLTRQNFLSTIQKLYIDLDVRHKVFESFKDKILNYEMQKTKIYHQYMDYIRGLKLDIYSHINTENPLPYFKLVSAIKKYRLSIKKTELDQKVNEQFGKNLGKWNQGIANDISEYNSWIEEEKKYWKFMNQNTNKIKKSLFEIYGIVSKQLKRQTSKINQNSTPSLKSSKSSVNFRKSIHKQKSSIFK